MVYLRIMSGAYRDDVGDVPGVYRYVIDSRGFQSLSK